MKNVLFSIAVALGFISFAQPDHSPNNFLGYALGSHFTRHHQVVDYFKHLQSVFPASIKVQTYGLTNEKRELITAVISSEENLKNLAQIKRNHEELKDEKIAIVWMSYNVHGNESAGTEAAMLTAFELITQRQDWLKNTVVILDPCINPDGRDRYVNWYNQQVSLNGNTDRQTIEHNEPWPSGRPNHYLFDLNRDWAWLTQVESQQRIKLYNEWMPHVHVDFHEQGINEPYYFAPAAEPYHEVITKWQRDFQTNVGKNNAKYFDRNGWFYFTKEIFDLLYPSYGDTYPTYNGAIGMTYEQGGSGRGGLGVITNDGDTLTLYQRLLHHHTTGLATVEQAANQANQLISEFQQFSTNKNYTYKSFIVGGNKDNTTALAKLLDAHQISYSYGTGATVKGFDYQKNTNSSIKATEDHLIISTNQRKGTLVNVLFEPKTKLVDSLTYDITAWSLPYAYGLEGIASEALVIGKSKQVTPVKNQVVRDAYAYIADWNSMTDARFLSDLLQRGIRVRFAENPFELNGVSYDRGTLIIARGDNPNNFGNTIPMIADQHNIAVTAAMTGMVEKGNDFGSSSVKLIPKAKVAMLTNEPTYSLNAGEIWHYFDHSLKYPVERITIDQLSTSALANYTTLIIPEGYYSAFSSADGLAEITSWVNNGGKLMVFGDALGHFTTENGYGLKPKGDEQQEEGKPKDTERHEHPHIAYSQQERDAISQTITGAIYACPVETSHPLAYGYPSTYHSLKLSATAYDWIEGGASVVYQKEKPQLLSGFAGYKAQPKQSKSLVSGVERKGQGCVIYFVDNPLFRGFWENGKLMVANALFFVNN
jgi:hypothetical protein